MWPEGSGTPSDAAPETDAFDTQPDTAGDDAPFTPPDAADSDASAVDAPPEATDQPDAPVDADAPTDASLEAAADSGADAAVDAATEDAAVDAAADAPVDAPSDAPADASTGSVSVVTWNLENFPLTDTTRDKVAGVLSSWEPDVVAVQEIADPDAFMGLAWQTQDYEAVLNDDPGGYQRVGLLYNRSRVQISQVETLFFGDFNAFPRPPLKASVRVVPSGVPSFDFTLVVVHLKAMMDEESEERRRVACAKLDTWIRQQLAQSAEKDIIVAGDFNDVLDDPTEDNVFLPFLDAPSTYQFLTQPLSESGQYSYIPYQVLIDHILVTTDALDEYGAGITEILPLENYVPGYAHTVSDHRPVRASFRLSAR